MEKFSKELQNILDHTLSVHDTGKSPEAFYHGLMIGLTASLHGSCLYEIRSNRESGKGRYDYAILSKDPKHLSILMEFKHIKGPEIQVLSQADMEKLLSTCAQEALSQIDQKDYVQDLVQKGASHILKIGLAFSGKTFVLKYTSPF